MQLTNIEVKGFDFYGDEQSAQGVLYDFISWQLGLHPGEHGDPNRNPAEMHFERFLTAEFTRFPVRVGFPLIGRECLSPACYMFIEPSAAHQSDHGISALLLGRVPLTCQHCGAKIATPDQLVYDVGLESLLLSQLTDFELSDLGYVDITPLHHIVKPNLGFFSQAFNSARLTELSKRLPDQSDIKGKQNLVFQVDSVGMLEKLGELIGKNVHLQGMEGMAIGREPGDERSFLLAQSAISYEKGSASVYKEEGKGKAIIQRCDIKLMPPIKEKEDVVIQDYYDPHRSTLWVLTNQGVLYSCDFRNMYDLTENCYILKEHCRIKWTNLKFERKSTRIVVTQAGWLYLLAPSQSDSHYMTIMRTRIPDRSTDEQVLMELAIGDREIRYRSRFGVGLVGKDEFLPYECILLYGGNIERSRTFKLLEIIALAS